MQTQLQTQNPKSSPALPPGRHRPAAGLARTLCAAALLAGASAVWGQQTYTGPVELKLEPYANGMLVYQNKTSQTWQIPKAGGTSCFVRIERILANQAGKITDVALSGSAGAYVKGDAFARLSDNSQARCTASAQFSIYGQVRKGAGCTAINGNLVGANTSLLKNGFTLVLTPKTFSCS